MSSKNLNLNPKQFEQYSDVSDIPPVRTRVYTSCEDCDHVGEFNSAYYPDTDTMAFKCHKCGEDHTYEDWFTKKYYLGKVALSHPDTDEPITPKNIHTALSKPSKKLPPVPKEWLQ